MKWCQSAWIILVLSFSDIEGYASRKPSYQPEQVHLSYGDNVYEIIVTWSTFNDTESVVEYGINGLALTATGTSTLFTDGGSERRQQYIHRVKLPDLTYSSTYVYQIESMDGAFAQRPIIGPSEISSCIFYADAEYHCGSEIGWSPLFFFRTPPGPDEVWRPKLAIYGDMGSENAQSLGRLQQETQRGDYDAILHVGDFAYDLDSDNARVGDDFMRQLESVAAYVPYMTCPGNHEQLYNFSNYRARFNMPGDSEGLWYSFNIGPLHVISFSTEVYYNLNYGIKGLIKQYSWLEADLKEATKPENRIQRPWIVTMAHRPMYCSNDDYDDCRQHETVVRRGLPVFHWFGLEDMFFKYGVDLTIWAHEHSYERFWPLYDYKVYNGSRDNPYTNPRAPVHIVTGSAGCSERTDPFIKNPPEWSAFRSSDYGYTRLQAFNSSHLYLEQVSDDKAGEVIDSLWLVKDAFSPNYAKLSLDKPSNHL